MCVGSSARGHGSPFFDGSPGTTAQLSGGVDPWFVLLEEGDVYVRRNLNLSSLSSSFSPLVWWCDGLCDTGVCSAAAWEL